MGIVPARAVRTCRVKLSTPPSFWIKLFERADPTENEARASNRLLFGRSASYRRSAFFDFNTFNARVINGSMPFSYRSSCLSSLMSTVRPYFVAHHVG